MHMQNTNKTVGAVDLLHSLPILNFLLSLLIVFHHGFTRNVGFIDSYNPLDYGVITAIERYFYNFSECAVPIFFFLSAFLFYRTFDGSKEKYISKMKRRFWSLVVPYIIFNTIGYFKAMVFSGRYGGALDYLLSIWNADTMPLWFIRELIFFSILAPVIYRIKRHLWLSVVVSVALIILSTLGLVGYRSFMYWMPVYLMGSSLTENRISRVCDIFERASSRYLMLLLFVIYCLAAWFLPNGSEKGNAIYSFEFTLFRFVSPLAFSYVIICIMNLNIKVKKWMQYSFFVYCMHAPIITLVTLVYSKMIPAFYGSELFQFFVVIFLTYVLCVILAMFLERYLSPVWKILNGKR